MTEFVVLAAAEAERVRGLTKRGHALDPVALDDAVRFILPLEVLADPAHAEALAAYRADGAQSVDVSDPRRRREVAPEEMRAAESPINPRGKLGE